MDVRLQVGLNFKRLRIARGPTVLTLHELSRPLGAEPIDLLGPIENAA
jgi:hypothetical protein